MRGKPVFPGPGVYRRSVAGIPAWIQNATIAELRQYWDEGLISDEGVYLLSRGQIVPAEEREKARTARASDELHGIDSDRDPLAVDVALDLLQAQAELVQRTQSALDEQRARMDGLIAAAAASKATSREIARAAGLSPQMVNIILRGRPSKATGKPRGRPAKTRRAS